MSSAVLEATHDTRKNNRNNRVDSNSNEGNVNHNGMPGPSLRRSKSLHWDMLPSIDHLLAGEQASNASESLSGGSDDEVTYVTSPSMISAVNKDVNEVAGASNNNNADGAENAPHYAGFAASSAIPELTGSSHEQAGETIATGKARRRPQRLKRSVTFGGAMPSSLSSDNDSHDDHALLQQMDGVTIRGQSNQHDVTAPTRELTVNTSSNSNNNATDGSSGSPTKANDARVIRRTNSSHVMRQAFPRTIFDSCGLDEGGQTSSGVIEGIVKNAMSETMDEPLKTKLEGSHAAGEASHSVTASGMPVPAGARPDSWYDYQKHTWQNATDATDAPHHPQQQIQAMQAHSQYIPQQPVPQPPPHSSSTPSTSTAHQQQQGGDRGLSALVTPSQYPAKAQAWNGTAPPQSSPQQAGLPSLGVPPGYSATTPYIMPPLGGAPSSAPPAPPIGLGTDPYSQAHQQQYMQWVYWSQMMNATAVAHGHPMPFPQVGLAPYSGQPTAGVRPMQPPPPNFTPPFGQQPPPMQQQQQQQQPPHYQNHNNHHHNYYHQQSTSSRQSSRRSRHHHNNNNNSNHQSAKSGGGRNSDNNDRSSGASDAYASTSQTHSPLLSEYKATGRRFELEELSGHMVEFARDSHGSRFLQYRMETAETDAERQLLLDEVLPQAVMLMSDVFGNYVIQNFLDHGSKAQCRSLIATLHGHLLHLSTQMHGCRVVQKVLQIAEPDQLATMINELRPHVGQCARDAHATHVMQKVMTVCADEERTYLERAVNSEFLELSVHPHAYRFVQRVLDKCDTTRPLVAAMLETIEANYEDLAVDQHGNFILQHLLDNGTAAQAAAVQAFVCCRVMDFARHKFASHLVEKCLVSATGSQRHAIVAAMLGPLCRATVTDSTLDEAVMALMKDPYANFVVQKAFDVSEGKQRVALAAGVRMHADLLNRFTYGRHILMHVNKTMTT